MTTLELGMTTLEVVKTKEAMKITALTACTLCVMFELGSVSWCQSVITSSEIPCQQEEVSPNLEVHAKTHLLGKLEDPTGAPFSKSKVELKKPNSRGRFIAYRTAMTDEGGKFDLKQIDTGKYRFLPVPNRGFKQPDNITCSEQPNCELNLVLEVNFTDQPYAGCPIQ